MNVIKSLGIKAFKRSLSHMVVICGVVAWQGVMCAAMVVARMTSIGDTTDGKDKMEAPPQTPFASPPRVTSASTQTQGGGLVWGSLSQPCHPTWLWEGKTPHTVPITEGCNPVLLLLLTAKGLDGSNVEGVVDTHNDPGRCTAPGGA